MTEEEREKLRRYITALHYSYSTKGDEVDAVITSLLMEVLMKGHNTMFITIVEPYPLTTQVVDELNFIHYTKTGCELTEKGKEFLRGSS